jgi:hypothetical protein
MDKFITLKVKANKDIATDCEVMARLDFEAAWRHELTLYFENGDYADINFRFYRVTGRYITTYETMYAVDAFIQQLKEGSFQVTEARRATV